MPKITAWKCPHTGKLFEEYGGYKRHLAALSRERCRGRKWQKMVDTLEDVITPIQQVTNMQEWCDFFMSHQKEFILYGSLKNWPSNTTIRKALKNGWDIEFPKLKSIEIINTRWSESVSNSHNCPRDGYTNWGGRKEDGGIRGYPGWHGRVICKYDNKDARITLRKPGKGKLELLTAPSISDMTGGFSSDRSVVGLNTGSGGGGGGGAYEAYMYQADFPNMNEIVITALEEIEKDMIWQKIKNNYCKKDTSVLDNVGMGIVEK